MNTVAMNNLWSYLQGLSLTAGNRKWLVDKLNASLSQAHKAASVSKAHASNITLPSDKFVGLYDFSAEEEERMRLEHIKEKYNLD